MIRSVAISTLVWLARAAVFAGYLCNCPGLAHAVDIVIPAGREAEVLKVVAPYALGGDVAEGFRLNAIQVGQDRIDLVLEHQGEPVERVTLALRVRSTAGAWFGDRYDLSIEPPDEQQSPRRTACRREAARCRRPQCR